MSNLCFAFGQVILPARMAQEPSLKDLEIFGILYPGAMALTLVSTLVFVPLSLNCPYSKQLWTLIYLGAVASGISFFLWNIGARKVNTGALAIFNNLKIPLAVAVSLLIFKEQTNLLNLLIGGAIVIAASHPQREVHSRTGKKICYQYQTQSRSKSGVLFLFLCHQLANLHDHID